MKINYNTLPESDTHKFIKIRLGEILEELGYNVEIEKKNEDGGFTDVHAEKEGEEDVNIEVWKSHMPDWLIVRLIGNITGIKHQSKKNLKEKKKNGIFLRNYCIGMEVKNGDILCTLCLKDGKYSEDLKSDSELSRHITQVHMPIDWEKYKSLDFGPENKKTRE